VNVKEINNCSFVRSLSISQSPGVSLS